MFVITKCDLVAERDVEATRVAVSEYAPGVEVSCTTTMVADGTRELRPLFEVPSTAALIGHSGVGKSALINAITGEYRQLLGGVRERDSKGRHTTTARQLFEVPDSESAIIDTPGLRELGLAVSARAIDNVFDEVAALASSCRFQDCSHTREPGCAVNSALEAGLIETERAESYRRLQREAAFNLSKALPAQRDKSREYTRLAREYRKARGR